MIREPQIKIPTSAARGEVVRVRVKIPHPMETGWRKDHHGKTVTRNRITELNCTLGGEEVFRAEFHSGVAANPYLTFFTEVTESGTFVFNWTEDNGRRSSISADIEVT
jgi:sulfur-oxidizing protein SoxZ